MAIALSAACLEKPQAVWLLRKQCSYIQYWAGILVAKAANNIAWLVGFVLVFHHLSIQQVPIHSAKWWSILSLTHIEHGANPPLHPKESCNYSTSLLRQQSNNSQGLLH